MKYERHENGGEKIKDDLRQASRKSREDMDALKQQVRSEAKGFKKSAGEALEAHDMEREIRHERIRAEAAHIAEQHQLKKDVEAEAKEFKDLIGQK
jgi:hypothetical protein